MPIGLDIAPTLTRCLSGPHPRPLKFLSLVHSECVCVFLVRATPGQSAMEEVPHVNGKEEEEEEKDREKPKQ